MRGVFSNFPPISQNPNSLMGRLMARRNGGGMPESFIRGSNTPDPNAQPADPTASVDIPNARAPIPAFGGGASQANIAGSNTPASGFSNLGVRAPPRWPGQLPDQFATVDNGFALGGMVGPGGQAIRPGQQLGAPQGQPQELTPQAIDLQAKQFAMQQPEAMQQIQQAFMQAMQSGELTSQELNMLVQMAQVAINEPAMWGQLRQFAIQQGIATEQDIPEQYDPGLLFVVLLAARAMQGMGAAAAGAPQQQMGMGAPPQQGQGAPVDIKAHEGEYVIPKNVVDMKGREFFDNLIGKYQPNGQ